MTHDPLAAPRGIIIAFAISGLLWYGIIRLFLHFFGG